MREIIFRGKRADNGEWVEGNLFIPDKLSHRQAPTEILVGTNVVRISYEIIPETIGQYTGLTDKNGKKIFEGDILVFCKGATHPIKVYWDGLGWKFLRNGKRIEDAFECNTISHIQYCEVIGNIHDNPELLKGDNDAAD